MCETSWNRSFVFSPEMAPTALSTSTSTAGCQAAAPRQTNGRAASADISIRHVAMGVFEDAYDYCVFFLAAVFGGVCCLKQRPNISMRMQLTDKIKVMCLIPSLMTCNVHGLSGQERAEVGAERSTSPFLDPSSPRSMQLMRPASRALQCWPLRLQSWARTTFARTRP